MTELTLQDFTTGQRVRVKCEHGPKPGVVLSVGRKYVYVSVFGHQLACLPDELQPL